MKRVIHSASHRIEILKWYEYDPDNTCMEFGSPISAFNFLCGFMLNHFDMLTLRSILADGLYCADISRSTDHEICQQVACQITHGYIKLVPIAEEIPRARIMGATTPQSTSRSTATDTNATQTAEREAPRTYTPTQTAEETESEPGLVPEGAAATQAATMTQAAESGAPFCET